MEPSSGQVFFRDAEITGLPQQSYQITNIFPHLRNNRLVQETYLGASR